jgi:hypothetical protein
MQFSSRTIYRSWMSDSVDWETVDSKASAQAEMPDRGKMFIEKMTPQKQSAVGTKCHAAPLVLNVFWD